MKVTIISLAAIIGVMAFSPAFAQDRTIDGSISATGILTDVGGSKAKFNEYRDTRDGVYGDVRLGYDSDRYYFNLKGTNFGYDDERTDWGFDNQSYRLDGGRWGKFNYLFFYDEIPHNIPGEARSFHSGIGSANLTGTPGPTPDPAAWNRFDYSLQRKQYGGKLGLDLVRPLYAEVAYVREEREGVKPAGINISNPGGGALEIPEPIDYITNTLKAEVGYSTRPLFAALTFSFSDFDNDHDILTLTDPFGQSDALSLPPDNESYRLGFKGALALPLNSRLTMNLSLTKNRSDADLIRSYVFEGTPATATYLNESRFNGTEYRQNYSFVLTSRPVPFLNAKAFYTYYDSEDRSEKITQSGQAVGIFITNHPFSYTKNSAGAELHVKLPGNVSLIPAYKYVKVDRGRGDIPRTEDDMYSLDLRWTGLAFMTVSVGYERLERDGNWSAKIIDELAALDPTDPTLLVDAQVERFVRRYDAADQERDTFKAAIELFPMDNLTLGAGFKYKKADYDDTVLGLREDKRYEINISADYAIGKLLRLFGYFDFERTRFFQFQRRYNNNGNPNPFAGPQNIANFNWNVTQVEKSYDYGIATDVYIVPQRVTLQLQYNHFDSDGSADYAYLLPAALPLGANNANIDIENWDDYRKDLLLAKVIFTVTKSISVSAGYAYEQYRYTDAAVDNYQFVFPAGALTAATTLLTGAYSNPSYHANVVFASVAYKF